MNQVIVAKNLDVGYEKKVVVENVNINGIRGQLICLLGPNGAGKSTILRTLTGLLAPVNGTVYVNETDLLQVNKGDLAKKLAIVLTEQLSLGFLTVFEIAAMGRYPHTNYLGKLTEHDIQIVEEALAATDALWLKDRYYSELSDGEKQKIMIARALVQEPELIVLDEPTSHLDVKHKVEVIRILQELCVKKGITVVLSLHDIDLAIKGCQTILLVQNGKIVAQGTPEEIIQAGTIQKLYAIEGAHYNELMGSLEFNSPQKPEVFVTGGNGTGVSVYRALARAGLGMYCGVLHSNDIDLHIGKALNCEMIEEHAFHNISAESLAIAADKIASVDHVIDTGFPLGNNNQGNLDLLNNAVACGKKVFSLCPAEEMSRRFGAAAAKVVCCSNLHTLIGMILNDKQQ